MNKPTCVNQSPLPAPPEGATLRAALFTSYRPVAPEFLLSDVLPTLLGIDRENTDDIRTGDWFTADALNALMRVPDGITVITSGPADDELSARASWLNRFVQPFMVGCNVDCIQHAKLWLCHWATEDEELLQITISSTNLTADAFRGQIQAGWTITLPVGVIAGKHHGVLTNFLEQLGRAADCAHRTDHFCSLLARCPAVPGSHFVASVPGAPSPLGVLKKLGGAGTSRRRLRILTPSIGDWGSVKGGDLHAWCLAVGVKPSDVELVWPSRTHDWVGSPGGNDTGLWKMPATTLSALSDAKVQLSATPQRCASQGVFANTSDADTRWGHAKFYEFNNGLLLGSHNWSKSAWGLSTRSPQNFELSVFVENARLPLARRLAALATADIALIERAVDEAPACWLRWAQATWDGKTVEFSYRLRAGCNAHPSWPDGETWKDFAAPRRVAAHRKVVLRCSESAPTVVRIVCPDIPDAPIVLAVTDIRKGSVVPLGMSAAIQEKADAVLLENYGGPQAESGRQAFSSKRKKKAFAPANEDDYRPEWLVLARKWRQVVDTWRVRAPALAPARARADAQRLSAALCRMGADDIGAAMAAKELTILEMHVR